MVRARAARERDVARCRPSSSTRRESASARAAAYGERARIARELHDVIAHSVSVMVIQAGGARLVMGEQPERAEESLRSVERAGREALAEMRRLLGHPRRRGPARAGAAAGAARTSRRCWRTRTASGISADLHVDGEPAPVSPALDLCAYRIVQEALTNAIKHAAPGARVGQRALATDDELELEISDDGRRRRAVNGAGGGHGIAGHARARRAAQRHASRPAPGRTAGSPCAPAFRWPRRTRC